MQPDALGACRRLMLVRLDNAGDVIMLGPAIRALRDAHPAANLTLLASPAGAAAAELLPWLDDVQIERVAWQDASHGAADVGNERALVERLAAGAWDAMLIFTSFAQTPFPAAYAGLLAGIPIRAGQSTDFGGSVLTHQADPAPWAGHQVERNLHLVEWLGVPVRDRSLAVDLPREARARAARLLAGAGAPPILVVPGASCSSRRPSSSLVAGAVARLAAASRRPVVVAGTDRERHLAAPIVAAVPGAVSVVGQTTFRDLAALIERAALVVSANSASMHLADALRRPLVALFAGTDLESQFAPRDTASVVLRRATACRPCYLMECPFANECLDVDADAIVEAGLRLLDAAAPAGSGSHEEMRWTASVS
jgi:ADP-heptose:LPS heptosyltransferase